MQLGKVLELLVNAKIPLNIRYTVAFDSATLILRSGVKITNDEMAVLYGLNKQAREGNVKGSPPSRYFNYLGWARWTAWNEQKGKTSEQAQQQYIDQAIALGKKYQPEVEKANLNFTSILDTAEVAIQAAQAPVILSSYARHAENTGATVANNATPPTASTSLNARNREMKK